MDSNKSLGSGFTPGSEDESSGGFSVDTTNTKESTIERNALPKTVKQFLRNNNGVRKWNTDPEMLYDYSENLIVEAFVDTLVKDVSNSDYTVESDEVREFLDNPHPEKTFNDILEDIVGDLLRTGNAFIVLNRYQDGSPAELVIPPASTMFKYVDENGLTKGYVQRVGRNQTNMIEKEDIYHLKWSNRNDKLYGIGPVEMSLDTIDVIDELTLMEILDLTEGGISKIVSQTNAHDQDPMNSQEWSQLKTQFHAQEGARHKNMLAKGSFDATTVSTDYSNFELIDRYKFHIQKLGSVFKVNPSYVGFDFENSNRATDVSQRESYKQRGIKTTLEMLKQTFNKLFKNEFDDNSFDWSVESTTQTGELEYYQQLGDAVQSLQEGGVPFEIQDDKIIIPEDAEITPDQGRKLSEISVLADMTDTNLMEAVENAENTNIDQIERDEEEKDFDTCVESVLSENPELSQEEAEAICGSKKDEIEMSEKKKAFTEAFENGSDFVETLVHLESESNTRREAINKCKDTLGEFSPNTYYKWIDMVGLK